MRNMFHHESTGYEIRYYKDKDFATVIQYELTLSPSGVWRNWKRVANFRIDQQMLNEAIGKELTALMGRLTHGL